MDSEGSLEILGNDETPEILVYIVAAFHVVPNFVRYIVEYFII